MAKKLAWGSFALFAALLAASINPAFALTAKECSAKFQEAKEAGTLKGQSLQDFRKAQCGRSEGSRGSANPLRGEREVKAKDAVYPTAIDPEFASMKPGQARRKTCAKQFQANKTNKANGGQRWLEEGGGYYSDCVKRLKAG
jgi:hypothetical protein